MNPARRGVLQALVGLVVGGKQVAGAVESAVAGSGLGAAVGALQPPANAVNAGIGLPTPPSHRLIAQAFRIRANDDERMLCIPNVPVHVSPHLAGLKSVPLHTILRMQREHNAASVSFVEQLAVRLGVRRDEMPWPLRDALDARDAREAAP